MLTKIAFAMIAFGAVGAFIVGPGSSHRPDAGSFTLVSYILLIVGIVLISRRFWYPVWLRYLASR